MAASLTATGVGAQSVVDIDAGLGAKLAEGYIAPAMRSFQNAAADTRLAIQDACEWSGTDSAAQIAKTFKQLVFAWAGIEFLRFGPLVDAHRFERIYFWPDPRGITTRQVQAMLAKPAGEIPDAKGLATHSVAMQGLPALEYVLYRNAGLMAEAGARDRASACAYAVAVAGNLEKIGSELTAQWDAGGEYARLFANPSSDNALYRNPREVASEMVKALSTGLQFQADVKLAPALGAQPAQADARKAPFWRSGLIVASLDGAARGMLAFYRAAELHFTEANWIDQNVQGELKRAVDVLSGMNGKTQALLDDENTRRDLVLTRLLFSNTKGLVDQDVAPAMGVRIGFNALDGD